MCRSNQRTSVSSRNRLLSNERTPSAHNPIPNALRLLFLWGGRRVEGDYPPVGERHPGRPHQIKPILREISLYRKLVARLEHVLPPAVPVKSVGRRRLGSPGRGLAILVGHIEIDPGVGI